jgi:antitoxin component YwqK of YwqJK toxin-antitoxin module
MRHGKYKEWWGNGKLWIDANFTNNVYDGEYKEYNISGKLIKYCIYDNGKEVK